jgi:aspartyl-tRNA(Asn)/glutamyl-tRNA(Gln) amidotransferase subunit B
LTDLKRSVPAGDFAELIQMIAQDELSSRAAKDTLSIMQEKGGGPREIAKEKNWMQVSDRVELEKLAREVLAETADAPKPYLVGQAMKKSGGKANPKILNEVFDELLGNRVSK